MELSSNTQTESGLEHKTVQQHTRFTPFDVPPEQYASYITTGKFEMPF